MGYGATDRRLRILRGVMMLPLLLAAFELLGKLEPAAPAAVSLHATASPFAVSSLAGPDGRFRFKGLEQGSYTLSVFLPGSGEMRQTIDIGANRCRQTRPHPPHLPDFGRFAAPRGGSSSLREVALHP
jgi:hypothetical protein